MLHASPQSNLYHLLLNWAWFDMKKAPPWAPTIEEREVELAKLPPEERAAVQRSVEAVAAQIKDRSVLFDEGLLAVRAHLAGDKRAQVPSADQTIVQAVDALMPMYKRRWWSKHKAQNQAWISALLPTLRAVEGPATTRLAAAYGGQWPKAQVPIDVVVHAVPVGAYSAAGRVTISSTRSGYEMPWALEMVLHEASHLSALEPSLREALKTAFAAAKKTAPVRLWHDLIFFTSGEVIRLVLADQGKKDYKHYGEVTGVYSRGAARWTSMQPILERNWSPFIASGSDDPKARVQALRAFAEALPAKVE